MTTDRDRERLVWELEEMDEEWFQFRMHLLVYVGVNAMLAFTDLYVDGGGAEWFFWPLFGWGIGVAMHYLGLRRHQQTLERRAERLGLSTEQLAGSR